TPKPQNPKTPKPQNPGAYPGRVHNLHQKRHQHYLLLFLRCVMKLVQHAAAAPAEMLFSNSLLPYQQKQLTRKWDVVHVTIRFIANSSIRSSCRND
ncbi:MAG: hypothetical protein P4M10_08975, partial [Verrucomicrobiae bacterium]|nr:hypothetical protein [Verrucomicrobiae bacterium]